MNIQAVAKAARQLSKALKQQKYEGSLLEFAEYVWPVVEPAIPFIRGWVLAAICDHLQAVTDGYIRRLLINVPPGFTKSLMTDVFWPAWEWGPKNRPWLRYMCAAYSNHLTERDNMRCRNVVISDRYKKLWGERFRISNEQFTKIKFANDQTGWKLATSISGIGTGERADRVIIDDPNNPKDMESEVVRDSVNMWFTEIIPDRLNNQAESAIVVIQQRTHEDDVSGTALTREMGYTHLCIPMYYVPARHVNGYALEDGKEVIKSFTGDLAAQVSDKSFFWEDPRQKDGELAWPERFSQKICEELQRDKGPYAWCNPGYAPVLMSDLSLKMLAEVKVGDEVLGFELGDKKRRARLKPAIVKSISVSEQPTVTMFMESGAVIHCTPNHKWWTGRNDKSHPPYAVAKVGSVLSRVCPDKLWEVGDDQEDWRLAGWLSGFFDGEGTVSLNHRRSGESCALIGFSQGTGRNRPLCEKLEKALRHFGFNFSYWDKPPARSGDKHKMRFYWLKASRDGRASKLAMHQQFLHVVQPTKWRDRLIASMNGGRLYTSSDRVRSIIPNGTDKVYGLETTTGNYVVWGIASSNSGQYMQDPEPRGGSIIKREFWQLWENPKYPPLEFILASLDTAYTAKEENDASALTVWGIFRDEEGGVLSEPSAVLWLPRETSSIAKNIPGNPKIILLEAWQERLEFNDLVQRVIETCTTGVFTGNPRFAVDRLIVEGKASGQSVGQELYRLFRNTGKMGIDLIDPRKYGDKVARVHAIQHLFADKMVYAPDKTWADMVINQCAIFPRGSHDDLVDSMSQALRYLRDAGFALKRAEHKLEVEEELRYKSNLGPLYPV